MKLKGKKTRVGSKRKGSGHGRGQSQIRARGREGLKMGELKTLREGGKKRKIRHPHCTLEGGTLEGKEKGQGRFRYQGRFKERGGEMQT